MLCHLYTATYYTVYIALLSARGNLDNIKHDKCTSYGLIVKSSVFYIII